jgi:NADH:ubiquinone oxidoreductase subunit E
LDKLPETEREELLNILKRNYNYSKNIKTREAVSSLAEIIGVDYSVVYRIPANYLNDMLLSESDEEKVKLYSQYCAR